MGCRCDAGAWLIAGAGVGAFVAVLGAILIPVGDLIIESTVKTEAVIENGTTAYDNWISAGSAVYRQFWLYNVTNPEDVLKGMTPEVSERGPYTYKTRYLPKTNIVASDNHTVSFVLPAGAIFEPSLSVGPEEEEVTVLNLAVAGGYSLTPHFLLNLAIQSTNSSLFMTRSIKELLWGYKDPMLGSTIGIFYPYNDTVDGPYNVFTGKDDISKVSLIDTWMWNSTLSFWNDTYCDMINGTDASSFPPFLNKKKPLYFFSSDICRSVSAEYSGTHDLKGIDVYRYVLPKATLASPTVNPDNMCYCLEEVVTRNCTLAGVLDVSSCRGGFPVYISLPHFLHGSPHLTEAVRGLSPSEEHHFTYLDVEPITGFTLRFAKRLQVNMMYGPSKQIKILKNITDYTIFPVVWLNETAAMDDETAEMFKKELVSRIDLLNAVQIALMCVGAAVCVLCGVAACVVKRKGTKA